MNIALLQTQVYSLQQQVKALQNTIGEIDGRCLSNGNTPASVIRQVSRFAKLTHCSCNVAKLRLTSKARRAPAPSTKPEPDSR